MKSDTMNNNATKRLPVGLSKADQYAQFARVERIRSRPYRGDETPYCRSRP